ncbi:GNAT family N-acetyltransferase [Alginatibacterium sediminis]|uniref:GNAT family N-acetyltransferase n=1 Tax=Alginatibacterium sediminis TaxID=2164068 RepID=A0A420EID5_9ALTE|nr:GNAT family N-acetyltransferase [Alginatibacterium sediminis]
MYTKQISTDEIDDLLTVFDQYMVFYQQRSDPAKYKRYLSERLSNQEATVFIAYNPKHEPVGFVLNYHCFSSVSLGKVIVLNDLFVIESHRQQGIANRLIDCAIDLAKSTGSIRVDLSTAKTNSTAQALYEKLGFVKDQDYLNYSLATID